MFYVVLLAMVAVFAVLQLYRVLGKRTGHEQSLPKPAEDRLVLAPVPPRTIDVVPEARETNTRGLEGGAEAGIRAIIAADPSFDLGRFIEGAKSAYRMILEAYWKGDEETLGWLAADDVRDAFATAIAARTEAGHVLDNRLISVERAVVTDASLQGKLARITLRIDADIAAVTRDAEGNLVSGSMTDAVEAHDIWTFERTLRSADQNWKLAETDEA